MWNNLDPTSNAHMYVLLPSPAFDIVLCLLNLLIGCTYPSMSCSMCLTSKLSNSVKQGPKAPGKEKEGK